MRLDLALEFLTNVGRFLRFVLQGFSASLSQNFSMGLLALALSTFLWVFITNEQNPPRTGIFATRIPVQPVNVPLDIAVLGPIDSVVIRITAPADLWNTLTEANFETTVDLSEAIQGQTEMLAPVQAHSRDARVRIMEVVPSQVRVDLDTVQRQVVPVHVNLQQSPPPGFSYGEPTSQPAQVTVVGPTRLVSLVDVAAADVNLSNVRTSLRQSFPLVPRTARGYDISGVRIEPEQLVVEVPVTRHINYIILPVVGSITGTPSPGFWVSSVRVEPSVLSVVGPQDLLQPLAFLRTQPIDVANQRSSFTKITGLELPTEINLAADNAVRVSVTIEPIRGNASFYVAPQVLGLNTSFTAEPDVRTVQVTVSGDGPALSLLRPEQISVRLNMHGEGPGTYPVEVDVRAPSEFRVLSVEPKTVNVQIR